MLERFSIWQTLIQMKRIIYVGWPCRFHVDKVSSAHVYLRLKKGETIDTISEGLLEDCAQLVKAHSIQGTYLPILAVYSSFFPLG